jgi:hypothetical protein
MNRVFAIDDYQNPYLPDKAKVYCEVLPNTKATATSDIKEVEDKGLLKNIGTKGSSAVYKPGVGSRWAHAWLKRQNKGKNQI